MSRPLITEAELQGRLEAALAIEDETARRRAANKARRAIQQLQYRSTLGSGARIRMQGR